MTVESTALSARNLYKRSSSYCRTGLRVSRWFSLKNQITRNNMPPRYSCTPGNITICMRGSMLLHETRLVLSAEINKSFFKTRCVLSPFSCVSSIFLWLQHFTRIPFIGKIIDVMLYTGCIACYPSFYLVIILDPFEFIHRLIPTYCFVILVGIQTFNITLS